MDKVSGSDNLPASESAVMASIVPNVSSAELLGADHPIVETAVEAICGGDLSLIEQTPRELAGQILADWPHAGELSDHEREAALARFPETVAKSMVLTVFDLGWKAGEMTGRASIGDVQAYAKAYIDGLNALVDGRRVHAFTVTRDAEVDDKFTWQCQCGHVTIQYPAGEYQTPINDRLIGHIAEATAVDVRTARALQVDGCSCPPEIGDHQHRLYIRRLAPSGIRISRVDHLVVEALFTDETGSARLEVLCWLVTKNGVLDAARWVGEHGARWEDGSPVTAAELARRTARSLEIQR